MGQSQGPVSYNQVEKLEIRRQDATGVVFRFLTRKDVNDVWNTLATTSGLRQWTGDSAYVELRPGGIYRIVFNDGLVHELPVTSFVPGRSLTVRNDLAGSWTTWQLEPISGKGTRVTAAVMGLSTDWDRAQETNVPQIEELARHFCAFLAEF